MSRRHIIIRFGGHWNNNEYNGGEEELLFIPSSGITRGELLEEIHSMVQADVMNFDYILYSLMSTEEGRNVKMRIKSDSDVDVVLGTFQEPNIFVALKRKQISIPREIGYERNLQPSGSNVAKQSFVELLNSQNPYSYPSVGGALFSTGYGLNSPNYMQWPESYGEQPLIPQTLGPNSVPYVNQSAQCALSDYVHPPAAPPQPFPHSHFVENRHCNSLAVDRGESSYRDNICQMLSSSQPQFDHENEQEVENVQRANWDCGRDGTRFEEVHHDQGNEQNCGDNDDAGAYNVDHDVVADDSSNDDDDDEDAELFANELCRSLYIEFCGWMRHRGGIFPGDSIDIGLGQGGARCSPNIHPNIDLGEDTAYHHLENDVRDATDERRGRIWVLPGSTSRSSPSPEREMYELVSNTLYVGATFFKKDDLITAVGYYHLQNRVEYRVERSSPIRYSVVCKQGECPFLLRAVGHDGMWRVIKFEGPHSCQLDLTRQSDRQLRSKIIGAVFAPKLLDEDRVLRPKDIMRDLERDYGLKIHYNVALKAKQEAITCIYGTSKKSFKRLPGYLYMLKRSNPGTVTRLHLDENKKFRYVFFALGASINGFLNFGRPVIVIDGTHLKGKYRGIMFVAVSKDGDEKVFPLAIGIGDIENDQSWTWFLTQLRDAYGCPDDLLIVSDQHPSIQNAIDKVYPGTPHGICTYHLQNKLAQYGKHVVAMYNNAAYCYRVDEYERYIDNIKMASEHGAYLKLVKALDHRWARCKCPVRRYGFMTSNAAESLNARLLHARRLPVCSVLESARTVIEEWFYKRRTECASRDHELTENAAEKLGVAIEGSRSMNVTGLNSMKYKVMDGRKSYVVNMRDRTCTCRMFELDLIPCSHAAAAIRAANHSIGSFIASYYKMDTRREMYAGEVMPVPHPDDWILPAEIKKIKVKAPDNPRQAGRPKTCRIPSAAESSSRSNYKVCSRCKQSGHNRVKCTAFIPLPTGSEAGSCEVEQPSRARRRGERRCSVCHETGHRRDKCTRQPVPIGEGEI